VIDGTRGAGTALRAGRGRRQALIAAVMMAATVSGCARAQLPGKAAAPALARADTAALHRTLDSIADAHHGIVGYTIHNLETGERLERRGDETFPTASLIKVPILVTVYDLVAKGQLALTDPLTVLRIDQVGGAGVLQYMRPGLTISVADAAWLMATISDNTATNLLVDRIAARRVWQKMEALGLPHSKVHGRSMNAIARVSVDSAEKYGLGVTTPNEMAALFELLARGKAVNAQADSAMLDVLEHNEDSDLLQRFTGGVRAAHKTGATDRVRTECTLWYLSSRVVACVLTRENADTRWVLDNEAQLTMGRMGEAIVRAWTR